MLTHSRLHADALYTCLGSSRPGALPRTMAILEKTGVSSEFLADVLQRELQTFRNSRTQRARLFGLTLVLFVLAHGQFFLGWHVLPGVCLLFLLPALALMQQLTMQTVLHYKRQRRIRNILFLLQEFPSVARVGLYVDALRCGDAQASALAQALLVQTLPDVTHGMLLTPGQHAALRRTLYGTNANLIRATLAAFARIGVPRERRAVRRLVSCPVWLADAQQISEAARACLAAMNAREREQRARQTLVRALTQTAARTDLHGLTQTQPHTDLLAQPEAHSRLVCRTQLADCSKWLDTSVYPSEVQQTLRFNETD